MLFFPTKLSGSLKKGVVSVFLVDLPGKTINLFRKCGSIYDPSMDNRGEEDHRHVTGSQAHGGWGRPFQINFQIGSKLFSRSFCVINYPAPTCLSL